MNVVRYEPLTVIRQFRDDVNRLFRDDIRGTRYRAQLQGEQGAWKPAIDITEEPERYVISADVPGVEPNEIEITMNEGVLSIKGGRASASREQSDRYSRTERGHGQFERRFHLPEGADAEGIAASSNHGVLNVSIPKKLAPQPRRIEIQ